MCRYLILKVINQSITREQQRKICHERKRIPIFWKVGKIENQHPSRPIKSANDKKGAQITSNQHRQRPQESAQRYQPSTNNPMQHEDTDQGNYRGAEKKPNTKCIYRLLAEENVKENGCILSGSHGGKHLSPGDIDSIFDHTTISGNISASSSVCVTRVAGTCDLQFSSIRRQSAACNINTIVLMRIGKGHLRLQASASPLSPPLLGKKTTERFQRHQ
jgi:hypothetical protein